MKPKVVNVGDILNSSQSGKFKVIRTGRTKDHTRIRFINTGYEKTVNAYHAKKGQVLDPYARVKCGVGYMGRERGARKTNRKTHAAWGQMISSYHNGGARVCYEWLNFSNYERWYEKNNPNGDLWVVKKNGATIYCKEAVRVVTKEERNIEISSHRMNSFRIKNTETGETIDSKNARKISRYIGVSENAIATMISGKQKTVKGWVLVSAT